MSLFRFGKRKYLETCLNDGRLSFGPAEFKNPAKVAAPKDAGRSKPATGGGLVKSPAELRVDYHTYGNTLKYYFISFAGTFDEKMYKEFKADACLEITDEREFANRLDAALKEMNWKGCLGNVAYFNAKKLAGLSDSTEKLFSKNSDYKLQKESRMAILPLDFKELVRDRKEVIVKPLSDIARFV